MTALMRQFIVTALEQHELADEDPESLAFELTGIMFAANANFVLREDPSAVELATHRTADSVPKA